MECTENTMLELFEKHASSKAEAKRVYSLVAHTDLLYWELNDLLSLKGMGRQGALLCMQVACDLMGKK